MDDTTRSIIRNVKGPGTIPAPHSPQFHLHLKNAQIASFPNHFYEKRRQANFYGSIVREDDILCLLESEREARRLR